MALLTPAGLCWTLLAVCVAVLASDDQKTIAAESGQKVTLTCQVTKDMDKTLKTVRWTRADLGDKYVLFVRKSGLDPEGQHPSFTNRVDLQDRQMKDGDLSLILNNVTAADAGTYQCQIFGSSWELISSVKLRVAPPGSGGDTEDGGSVGLIVGLSVFAVLLGVAAVVGFFIYKKLKSQDSY